MRIHTRSLQSLDSSLTAPQPAEPSAEELKEQQRAQTGLQTLNPNPKS